jgi:hypothetical protein
VAATVAGFLEPFGSTLTAARMIFVCGMSAWGQSRRFDDVRATSALPLIADLCQMDQHVRNVPTAEALVTERSAPRPLPA